MMFSFLEAAYFHFHLIFYQLMLASSHTVNQHGPKPSFLLSKQVSITTETSQFLGQVVWGSQTSMTT